MLSGQQKRKTVWKVGAAVRFRQFPQGMHFRNGDSLQLLILLPARQEYETALAWYEGQFPGLGKRFRGEVIGALKRIRDFPDAWHPLAHGIRRHQLGRFPYGVIYSRIDETIVVLAISHLHRHPEHWRDRHL